MRNPRAACASLPPAWRPDHRFRLGLLLLCLALLSGLPAWGASGEDTGGGWYPAAGIGYVRPSDSEVRDLYPGGVGYSGAMGYGWPGRLRVEVRMDWHRQSAHPAAPLAEVSKSQLTLIPVTVEGHYSITQGRLRPYLLAGGGVLFSEEKFTYGIFESTTTSSGRRKDLVGVVGGGLERRASRWILRASARAVLGGAGRDVLRATGRSDDRGDGSSASLFTFGLELQLR